MLRPLCQIFCQSPTTTAQRNAQAHTQPNTYMYTRTHRHTCMRQCSVAHYNAEWESGSERERQHISLARSGCSPSSSGGSSEHLRCEWCVSRAYACVCGHNHACLLCCSCARTFVKENGLHTLTSCRTLRTQCGRCVFTAERRAHFLSTN